MFNSELLPIYLNDHLAGATAGRDLARRTASANEGTEFGAPLADLAAQVDADRDQLVNVMGALEVGEDQIKVGAGRLAEKLGRLKLNGRLVGYSPLSRVIEIEGLLGAGRAKVALWSTLAAAAPSDRRLAEFDFVHLTARADEQLEQLDELHGRAVEVMIAAEAASR